MRPRSQIAVTCAILSLGAYVLFKKPERSPTPPVVKGPHATDGQPKRSRVFSFGGGGGAARWVKGDVEKYRIRKLLKALGKTYGGEKRQKLLDIARTRMDYLLEPLLEILGDSTDHQIFQAITLVAELRVRAASDALTLLVSSRIPPVRGAALGAKERVDPWLNTDLENFLNDRDAPVLEAALLALSRRDMRPVDLIIPLLGHGDTRVRRAAVLAIPSIEPGEDLTALVDLASRSSGPTARAVAAALGRTGLPDEAERCLNELLDRKDWTVRRAALVSLAGKEGKLDDHSPVLRLISESTRSVEERVYGFLVLEKTRSTPVYHIRKLLPTLHPVLRLCGARSLLAVGDRSGLPVLVDLLDVRLSEEVDDEDRDCVRDGALDVLREISTTDYGPDRLAWLRWYRRFGNLVPLRLKVPMPTFW